MADKEIIKQTMQQRNQHCTLEIMDADSGMRQKVQSFDKVIEAPNWTGDGKFLIYNSEGKMYEYNIETGSLKKIDTGFAENCNNDHVLSPDSSHLAVSHFSDEDFVSHIYTLPRNGGQPRLVTQNGPSYLHGWSPDGKQLSFCGERNGQYNIFTIPVAGGTEKQLTKGGWLDDGPEYSPCGNYIWFNSERTGLMQIWKMHTDGSDPVRMTDNTVNSWFPHISPQGDRVVYLTYGKGEVNPGEHLPDKQVDLRIMDIEGGPSRVLAAFRGGQGTINVNSWSPDGKKIAFVSY